MLQEIELDVQADAVNEAFQPYLLSRARYRLFWGGRSSSKSDMACLDLLLQCLTLPYFKCIMVRKVADTIQGSLWATLKAVAEREEIDHLFFFGSSPLTIRCLLNDNSFIARGLDNPRKIKSVREPTHAIYEEANETIKSDFETVSTTLRCSRPGAVIQEIFLFNPDQPGDYKEFYLWKMFFEETGHPDGTTFSGVLATDLDGEVVHQPYEVMHSTIRDNRWASREDIAKYKRYGDINPVTEKMFDEYLYRIWYQGLWAAKQTGNEFYNDFNRGAHVKPTPYVEGLPILTSWDANALPYSHMLMCQPEQTATGLVMRFFGEYALAPPKSGLKNTATQFLLDRTAKGWQSSSVFLTGDSTLRNKKIGEESGSLFEDVVSYTLPALNGASTDLWPKKNANVMRRRDFLNAVFRGAIPGIRVQIDPDACPYLLADLEQIQTGVEGKVKVREKNKATGATYEKLGHASDNFDYSMLSHPVVAAAYEQFKAGRDG